MDYRDGWVLDQLDQDPGHNGEKKENNRVVAPIHHGMYRGMLRKIGHKVVAMLLHATYRRRVFVRDKEDFGRNF